MTGRALAAASALAGGLGTTAALAAALSAGGALDGQVVRTLAVGCLVAAVLSVAAACLRPRLPAVTGARAESERDALLARIAVADAVAAQYRREADAASAGVSSLFAHLVEAEEGARGQLAAELHDTVAQSLMTARSLLVARPGSPRELDQLSDYVEDAEEQLRAVMARTRPPALRDGDLASAVDGLRSDMHRRYGLQVHVRWPLASYPLSVPTAVTLYRFVQESLLNVVKHADVDDALVTLEVLDDTVVATVHDDGPGFDTAAVVPEGGRHLGLALMRERARLCGGSVEVESGPTGGAVVRLRLPRGATRPAAGGGRESGAGPGRPPAARTVGVRPGGGPSTRTAAVSVPRPRRPEPGTCPRSPAW